MIARNVYPKTKQELIDALKASNLEKLEVLNVEDRRIGILVRDPKKPGIKRSVIVIDEKA